MLKKTALRGLAGALLYLMILAVVGQLASLPVFAGASEPGRLYLPIVFLRYSGNPGTVQGLVVDAQTGQVIPDATVCFGATCAQTDGMGQYAIPNVPDGIQVLTASKSPYYNDLIDTVDVLGAQVVTLNFALSPALEQGEYRIVLSWNSVESFPDPQGNPKSIDPYHIPNDLDAYVWVPDDPNPPVKIYWENKGNCNDFPFICLESDVQYGSGPEAILVVLLQPGNYVYAVHDYADDIDALVGHDVVPPITQSGAEVRIYDYTGLIRFYTVPAAGQGFWWHVFDIDGANNQIIDVNQISDSQPLP